MFKSNRVKHRILRLFASLLNMLSTSPYVASPSHLFWAIHVFQLKRAISQFLMTGFSAEITRTSGTRARINSSALFFHLASRRHFTSSYGPREWKIPCDGLTNGRTCRVDRLMSVASLASYTIFSHLVEVLVMGSCYSADVVHSFWQHVHFFIILSCSFWEAAPINDAFSCFYNAAFCNAASDLGRYWPIVHHLTPSTDTLLRY